MVRRRPKAESATPSLDPATLVVAVETFRPGPVARMIEKGTWLALDSPVVRAWPDRFAVRLTDLEAYQENDAA
jgi:hypothetical protein